MNWTRQCVYQRVRIRTYYSRLHKLGYSSNIETTRENGFGITMYLCCVIVKRTCQYYGVDRSRHTMTLFFFILEPLGVKEIFSFKNILKSVVRTNPYNSK